MAQSSATTAMAKAVETADAQAAPNAMFARDKARYTNELARRIRKRDAY